MIYYSPLVLKLYKKFYQSKELKQLKEREKEIIKKLKEKIDLWFDFNSIEEFLDALEVLNKEELWKTAKEIPIDYWIYFLRNHIWRSEKSKKKFYENFNKYILNKN
ncbi:MAG: hypothetical protein ABGW69_00695 [Nanoarchaeota archaeon]